MTWYFLNGEVMEGPLTDEQLGEMFDAGGITEETLLWQEGMPEWLTLKQVGEQSLMEEDSRSSAPAPVPVPVPVPATSIPAGSGSGLFLKVGSVLAGMAVVVVLVYAGIRFWLFSFSNKTASEKKSHNGGGFTGTGNGQNGFAGDGSSRCTPGGAEKGNGPGGAG